MTLISLATHRTTAATGQQNVVAPRGLKYNHFTHFLDEVLVRAAAAENSLHSIGGGARQLSIPSQFQPNSVKVLLGRVSIVVASHLNAESVINMRQLRPHGEMGKKQIA